MADLFALFPLFTIHFVALMSPGPDFALVVQNTTRYGRNTGLMVALGLSCGILTHATLTLSGVSLLISNHQVLFRALQTAGGCYLLWLGIGAINGLRRPRQTLPSMNKTERIHSRQHAFLKGFSTNMLNPKALVFFVSLLSTLVPTDLNTTTKIAAICILWALSFTWFAFLAWVLTGKQIQQALTRLVPYIDGSCGVLFTATGGSLIWQTIA
ncbi:LysE family translocator [Thaumasiovibrio sp. DFM-14]|uniref:LysE family translocator n=1 Tax=Thaumasiovibrio sp. DFM-14 TaxID=3384792 RepID=UPI0039A28EA9